MTSTETKIKDCLEPIINNLGYELYDVIYEKEGKDNYLRIFIDKEDGIGINDCENVNNAITDILDEKDFIKNPYMLEVSSPGIERRLRTDAHLEKYINKKIEIHTFKNIEIEVQADKANTTNDNKTKNTKKSNQKIIVGTLKEFNDQSITIEEEQSSKIIEIQRKDISSIKTIFNWEEK